MFRVVFLLLFDVHLIVHQVDLTERGDVCFARYTSLLDPLSLSS